MKNKSIMPIAVLATITLSICAALAARRSSPLFPGMAAARYRFQVGPPAAMDATIPALEKRTDRPDANALDLAELSTLYFQQGHLSGDLTWYDKAEAAAKRSLRILPTPNAHSKLTLAKVADARHEFPEAIRIADEVRKENGSPGALAILISSHLALGELGEAARFADQAVDVKPDSGAYLMRALVLEAQGRDEEAAFDFQRSVAVEDLGSSSESARLRALWGRFLARHGMYGDAEALYNESLRIVPGNHLALALYGETEMQRGNFARAQKLLMDAFSASKQMRYFIHYALAKKLAGDAAGAAEAQATAEKMVREELKTGKFGHRLELVELLLERGTADDIKEAVPLAEAELKVRRSAEAYYYLAKTYWKANRLDDAVEPIRAALRTGVKDPRYYGLAAAIEQARGNHPHAGFYRAYALKLDPEMPPGADGFSG